MSTMFNSVLIKEESNNIKKEKEALQTIYDTLNSGMESLNEYWDSNTKDEIYAGYKEFKDHYLKLLELFNNDIQFLDGTISDYETFENNANKEINNNIAG